MKNEILWVIMLLINFACILFAYWRFGKMGLYIWVPISSILANIQVVVLVNLFGLSTTLGNILFAGSFLATDILSENHGKDEAFMAVKIGFFSLIATTIIMRLTIMFIPENSTESFKIFESMKTIFGFLPRITFASLVAYLLSQTHDVWAYNMWKKKFQGRKYIWIRNNMSTLVSQLIDNVVFVGLAFAGVFSIEVMIQIFISTYVLKCIVSVCDTPFVYIANSLSRPKL